MNESLKENQGDQTLLNAMIIFQCLIGPPIAMSNILIIAAPIYTKMLRTPDNLLMVNLAIADLITGLYSGPMDLVAVSYDDYLGIRTHWFNCYMFLLCQTTSFRVSLFTVFLMSLDKFLALHFPYKYIIHFDVKVATLMILFAWTFTGLNAAVSSSFFEYDLYSKYHRCRHNLCFTYWWRVYDGGCVAITIILIWVLTLVFLRKVIHIRRESRKLTSNIVINSIYKAKYNNNDGVNTNMFLISINSILLLAPAATVFTGNTPSYEPTVPTIVTWRLPLCANAVLNVFVFAYYRTLNRAAYRFLITNPPWRWKNLNANIRNVMYLKSVRGERRNCMNILSGRHKRTLKLKMLIANGLIDQIEESSMDSVDSLNLKDKESVYVDVDAVTAVVETEFQSRTSIFLCALSPPSQHGSALSLASRHGSALRPASRHGSVLLPASRRGSVLRPASRHGSVLRPASSPNSLSTSNFRKWLDSRSSIFSVNHHLSSAEIDHNTTQLSFGAMLKRTLVSKFGHLSERNEPTDTNIVKEENVADKS